MKYLVVIKDSLGFKAASIFDNKPKAEEFINKIVRLFDVDSNIRRKNNANVNIRTIFGGIFDISLIETAFAEYRLCKYSYAQKIEERKFLKREDAIKFVNNSSGNTSKYNDDTGYWPADSISGDTFKLYCVICDGKNTPAIIDRFDSLSLAGISCKYLESDNTSYSFLSFLDKFPFLKGGKCRKIAAVLMVLLLFFTPILTIDWQLLRDESVARNYQFSNEITAIANELNLTRKGKSILFAAQPKLMNRTEFNKTCGRDGNEDFFISGCYYLDDDDVEHIDIYNIGTSTFSKNGFTFNYEDYRRMTVLHETLHAAWERLGGGKQTKVCSELRDINRQIPNLQAEIDMYSNDQLCSELFARVGTEYVPYLASGKINVSDDETISNITNIYSAYFDIHSTTNIDKYWANMNNLALLEDKIDYYYGLLSTKKTNFEQLQDNYYRRPTLSNYYSAKSSLDEYNNLVNIYNSYLDIYTSIHNKLDSEIYL